VGVLLEGELTTFKPMLASDAELDKLRFPLLASAKLDGVRAVVKNGVVLSRSLKPIPNEYVQSLFKHLEHFDGELIVGEPTSKTVYRDTVSGVMSKGGEPDVTFFVFDHIEYPTRSYRERIKRIRTNPLFTSAGVMHEQHIITCLDTLLTFEQQTLDEGYEGLILRDPDAPYKFGRSTAREGYLLKLKRFTDAEFEVIGFEERMHNGNEATTNELGRTARSGHKAGKTGRGDLGALVVRTAEGLVFNVGTGFDDALRAEIWSNQDKYKGALAKVKFFQVGMKDAPRHPVFLGWRDERDS